jgi:outer membrane receptor for ferrienterochelin and colicin
MSKKFTYSSPFLMGGSFRLFAVRHLCFLAATLLSSAVLFAQDDDAKPTDTISLKDLSLKELLNVKITTASKTLQSADLASAVVRVITKEQIRSRGYQSLLDVLYDLPDFKIDDKMYSGIRNSVTVRGTQGSEELLIMLDGVVISSPSGEAMPIMQNYPVFLAERIEVLYGPASALYGANAVTGIINIITRKDTRKGLTAEATSTAGMYGYTNTTLYLANKFKDDTRLVVAGQYYYDRQPDYSKIYKGDSLLSAAPLQSGTFNSIYGPFTPVVPISAKYEAPMEAYNIYAGLQSGGFTFSLFHTYFKVPTSLENNTSNAVYNRNVFMGQTISMANASYKKSLGKVTSTTGITVSAYELQPKSNYRNLYTGMEPAYKYSNSSMLRLEQQFDYTVSRRLSMTGGIAYEHYSSIPQSGDLAAPVNTRINIQGVYLGTQSYYRPEGLPAQFYFIKSDNIGGYYQAQYSPHKQVNITLGARADNNSRYGGTFNPRFGVVFHVLENTTIKLMHGTAYRAPSPSDAYSHYGAFLTNDSGKVYSANFLHLPNPGLKPVKSYNSELNITQGIADNIMLTLDGYYNSIKRMYSGADDNLTTGLYHNVWNGISVDYIEVFVNRKTQRNYGGSMELNVKNHIGDLRLHSSASVSYANGIINGGTNEYNETSTDTEVDFLSPWMARLATDMKIGDFTCSPRLILVGRQRIAGIKDTTDNIVRRQTIPGYSLLNVSMRYQLNKHWSFSLIATNVLDQRYTNVSFNMDLKKQDTELYRGQPQDPIRIMGAVQISL